MGNRTKLSSKGKYYYLNHLTEPNKGWVWVGVGAGSSHLK